MKIYPKRYIAVPVALLLLSGMTILFAITLVVQIPFGALPEDSLRFSVAPFSHFAHAASGVAFGVLGPVQFSRVLARKFGRIHRITGRVFVIAGAFLALSSMTLLWHFPDANSDLVNGGRLVFGIGLGASLIFAMTAIRARNFDRHRNWMIRAYAVGMGATMVSNVFLPIYLITGEPPMGLLSDVAFIGSWAACVVFAELLVRRLNHRAQTARV